MTTDSEIRHDRGDIIGKGLLWLAKWSLCIVAIAAGAWVLGFLLEHLWVIVLPVALALVVATVLWPPTRMMRNLGMPAAAAAGISILGFFAVLAGVIALIVPSVIDQAPELSQKATAGVQKVQEWLQGPPLNIRDEQIDKFTQGLITKIQESQEQIASGVFTTVNAATSALVSIVLVLFLTFFFVKDGPRFLPWLRSVTGERAGRHLDAVLCRVWTTLGGFIRTQALVSLVDAIFIGTGLLILGVPLAWVLAVITFVAGFIPLVGAVVAGTLAVLVALVGNGFTTAVIVLIIVIVVQQIEGNVLQPILQSRSMQLHAVVVLLAVTAGGSLFGIVGAFLAVPVAAVTAVIVRYLGEQIAAETDPDTEAKAATPPPEPAAANPSGRE